MRTTVAINDDLRARAIELTGIPECATVIRMALESLVARQAGRRLIQLGGSDPGRPSRAIRTCMILVDTSI